MERRKKKPILYSGRSNHTFILHMQYGMERYFLILNSHIASPLRLYFFRWSRYRRLETEVPLFPNIVYPSPTGRCVTLPT